MGIKLIAIDMDGTLLDDEKRIPDENIKALKACMERGIEIVPATGRTRIGVPRELREQVGVRYAITVNGAVVADMKENRVLSTCKLSPKLAAKIMRIARDSQDEIMYDVYVDGLGYTIEEFYRNIPRYVRPEALEQLIRRSRRVVPDNIQYVEERNEDADKVNMFFIDLKARERMRQELRQIPGILVSSSIPNNLEINAAGADKGEALLRLAEYLGIAPEDTMGIGDGENDLSMIRRSGFGVAMQNGDELVKAAADYVTITNNEAGVADAIRRFVLK